MRRMASVMAVVVLAMGATGCQVARPGTRCRGGGFGQDSSSVLVCQGGRWRRAISFADLGQLLVRMAEDARTPVALDGGGGALCALMKSGSVKCRGDNAVGQLGDGTTTSRSTWAPVLGIAAVANVDVASDHACALLPNGDVRCWGANDRGQAGVAPSAPLLTPGPVVFAGASAVSAGTGRSCALRQEEAWCWGWGDPSPRRIEHTSGSVGLSVGGSSACVVSRFGGAVSCWGLDGFGQLGDGPGRPDSPNSAVVVAGGTFSATAVSVGEDFACALPVTGGVACWGTNGFSQLDTVTVGIQWSPQSMRTFGPTYVPWVGHALRVVAGSYSTCVQSDPDMNASPQVQCFGSHRDSRQSRSKLDLVAITDSGVVALSSATDRL